MTEYGYGQFAHKFENYIILNPVASSALETIEEGTLAYDVTLHKLVIYTNAGWETITSAGA